MKRKLLKIGDTVYVCGDMERVPEIITDMFVTKTGRGPCPLLNDYWALKRRPFMTARFDSGGAYAPLALCIPYSRRSKDCLSNDH